MKRHNGRKVENTVPGYKAECERVPQLQLFTMFRTIIFADFNFNLFHVLAPLEEIHTYATSFNEF